MPPKQKVVIVTGPTGVGKTDMSLKLAHMLDAEIISADSVQVYKHLDIGSDKISEEKRQGIRHHLIDVLEADQEFSAGSFYEMAREVTEDILKRGKTPLVVGGTGFYLRMYMYRRPETREATPELEAQAEQMLSRAFDRKKRELECEELSVKQKWEAGIDILRNAGDLEAAERIKLEFNNYYRLKRALQVMISGDGRPMSELKMDYNAELDYDFRCFFLHRPRPQIYQRILIRVEQMVCDGLLKEAYWLWKKGIDSKRNSANRSIGYRQAMDYIQACVDDPKLLNERKRFRQMILDVATASRNLVKSQVIFFRDNDNFKWIDATQPFEVVAEQIYEECQKQTHQGGCGDSGRLSQEEMKQVRTYVPKLSLFSDDKEVDKWTKQISEWLEKDHIISCQDPNQEEEQKQEVKHLSQKNEKLDTKEKGDGSKILCSQEEIDQTITKISETREVQQKKKDDDAVQDNQDNNQKLDPNNGTAVEKEKDQIIVQKQ